MRHVSEEAEAMTQAMLNALQTAALSVLLLFLWPDRGLHSQVLAGVITGQVVDQTDKGLPGVRVVVTERRSRAVTTAVTDAEGRYTIDVAPGVYVVRFEVSGFAGQEVPRIEVHPARTVSISVTLRVGSVTETVEVTAENARLPEIRNATVINTMTVDEIDQLPKTRTFQSIALMAPRTNYGVIEGGIQVNGASGAENTYVVDGVDTTSLINGASRQNTVFEYIQEVQVQSIGIPAEYGGALGGMISAITKSGGNIFIGETHYYLSASSLNAYPVPRLFLDPADGETSGYVQDQKQPERFHAFGGTLGGPIIRDRVFFFGSLSPSFHRRTNNYLFSSGRDHGQISRTSRVVQAFGKVSLRRGPLTSHVTGLVTPAYVHGSLPFYDGVEANSISSSKDANAINIKRGWEQLQINTTAKADIVLSNSDLATLRTGLFQDRYRTAEQRRLPVTPIKRLRPLRLAFQSHSAVRLGRRTRREP